jgi:hypothetical protein
MLVFLVNVLAGDTLNLVVNWPTLMDQSVAKPK